MDEDDIEIIYSTGPCWPFWGILETRGGGAYERLGWKHTCSTPKLVLTDIFDRFSSIGSRALAMLNRRTIEDMSYAATEIQTVIDVWFEDYIEVETESRVQTLSRNGGWELGYLPIDSRGTVEEIRDLLANWSNEWEKLDLPGRDDFSDLTALGEYLDWNKTDGKELYQLGFCEPEEHEFYAVLALMQICEAVHSNHVNPGESESLHRIKQIGYATIKAVETVAYGERVQFEQTIRRSIALKQPEILENELSRRRSEIGANAANKRHIENKAMKSEVFTWLDANMTNFKSMDSAASAIAGKIAPIAFRTARDWTGQWKKLRSASTP